MLRRLFTAASAISLLICAAMIALWVRSFRSCDQVTHYELENVRVFFSDSGRLGMTRTKNRARKMASFVQEGIAENAPWVKGALADEGVRRVLRMAQPHWEVARLPSSGWASQSTLVGFSVSRTISYGDVVEPGLQVIVPHWELVAIAAVLPAAWTLRLRRTTRRRRTGRCITCGYDLRASTDRCPECGSPIPVRMNA